MVLVTGIALVALGFGVQLGSLAAARCAGVLAWLLLVTTVVAADPGQEGPLWYPIGIAAAAVFGVLLAAVRALTAGRNAAGGGRAIARMRAQQAGWDPQDWPGPLDERSIAAAARRPPYPYPHPLPEPVKRSHIAAVQRSLVRSLQWTGLLQIPGGAAFFLGFPSDGTAATAAPWQLLLVVAGGGAVIAGAIPLHRLWVARLRHRVLLLEYGVLLNLLGREVPRSR